MEDHQDRPHRGGDLLVWTGAAFAFVLAVMPILLPSPVSIVCWFISLAIGALIILTLRRDRLPQTGYVTAWLAVVISGACILFFAGVTVLSIWSSFTRPHPGTSCTNNLHQLGLAMNSYRFDHNGQFPDPHNWPQQIIGYVKTSGIFICPVRTNRGLKRYPIKMGDQESLSVTFAMNERLKGLSVRDVKKPEETVLLFESNGEKLSGGPELLPKEMRHEEREYVVVPYPTVNVLFADGQVRGIPLAEVPHLKWDPK